MVIKYFFGLIVSFHCLLFMAIFNDLGLKSLLLLWFASLLKAFAENVRAELAKFPADVQNEVVILFSAHSLPMKVCCG